ncbi:iron-containing alcohol dehydrogenase [Alkalibacter rhizosphaerae]|uniref:Iron-containing alcohol dehydrogenase n=1 Tax=Alkalibacter rhizosphaerae TaxID=2815577 RepID=A0A975AHM3_9FIRM|nr:iron-containing alcohol dehydrogenase [Alkalibacter rhizosphaerae]QSX08168.1 iron-containing alcohol dehydrogenase [Alkalibacter rhizosphaerae]
MARYGQITPIVFGEGTIHQLGEETKNFGCSKVLLISDEGVAKTQAYELGKASLMKAGVEVVEFTKVLPDPPDHIVNDGGALARAEKVDGLVAIGGGSPIDAAKAINILVHNEPPINRYFGNPVYEPGLPLIVVPTTSGTGSEVTMIGVLTDTVNDVKTSIIGKADLGILDPMITVSVPRRGTVSTGMDAFAHACESITTKDPNPKSQLLAEDAIRRICKYLERAAEDGSDVEARSNLMLASNFAGIAFNDALVHLGHAIAHSVGAKFHFVHGNICAVALPEVMIYAASIVPERVKIVGEAMGIEYEDDMIPQRIGEKTAQAIRDFLRRLEVPSLKEEGLDRAELIGIADMVLTDPTYHFVPKQLTKKEVEVILGKVYDNY